MATPGDKKNRMRDTLWKHLQDKQIEDISLSSRGGLAYYKCGSWHTSYDASEPSAELLTRDIAHFIAETAGVTLSARHPSLDAHLEAFQGIDSFRAHVVVPPLSGFGTHITLRRIGLSSKTLGLEKFGLSDEHLVILKAAMIERSSILICGPTGSGKTSLLRSLLQTCGSSERIAILEDSAEVDPPNNLSFALRSRHNRFEAVEGSTWSLEQLVYESLRMRPDRIVLGECRGPEALGLLHAMQSGHRGILCTIHASSAAQAIERYQNLVRIATSDGIELSSAKWDYIVCLSIDNNHQRRATVHTV